MSAHAAKVANTPAWTRALSWPTCSTERPPGRLRLGFCAAMQNRKLNQRDRAAVEQCSARRCGAATNGVIVMTHDILAGNAMISHQGIIIKDFGLPVAVEDGTWAPVMMHEGAGGGGGGGGAVSSSAAGNIRPLVARDERAYASAGTHVSEPHAGIHVAAEPLFHAQHEQGVIGGFHLTA